MIETDPINGTAVEVDEAEMDEPRGCSVKGMVTFCLGLVFGTFSALLCKMAYDTKSEGLDGEVKSFSFPIMMLLLMFMGQIPAILIWGVQQVLRSPDDRDVIPRKTLVVLIIPALCDLACTALLLIAQLYITASLWQMMRGSVIVITALLKRFVLAKKLKKYMWAGVAIIAVAMVLVACTSFVGGKNEETSKDPRVGVVLVIVGCMAQGVQYVFEERVMAVEGAPPLVVIGMEGLWGTFLTLIVVYPLAYVCPGSNLGSFENPWDALRMMKNSQTLTTLCIAFVFTVTGYNCAAVYVTRFLSAIWHAILDNFRPITIWGLDLLIFYVIFPGTGFGEFWTKASWLQLAGLFVLFLGTAVYNGSVTTCGDDYKMLGEIDKQEGSFIVVRTPSDMSSMALQSSPLLSKRTQHLHLDETSHITKTRGYQEV